MTKLPINHNVLKWARESSNLSLDEVARKMNKDPSVISLWEQGQDSPTYIQLEKLAYNVFKRPVAVFFFPELPYEDTPKKSFRTLPDAEFDKLPTKIVHLIRNAQVMQINLYELCNGRNPVKQKIVQDIKLFPFTLIWTKNPCAVKLFWTDRDSIIFRELKKDRITTSQK